MENYKKVLVATDFGEPSIEAIKQAHELATRHSASLYVLHALPSVVKANPLFPEKNLTDILQLPARLAHAADTVADLVKNATGRDEDDFTIVVEDGWPDNVLLHTAESVDANLVVVGASNQSTVSKMVLGTVAQKVVRYAHCDVLIARPSSGSYVLAATDFSDPAVPAVSRAVLEAKQRDAALTVIHSLGITTRQLTSLATPFGSDVIVPDPESIEAARKAASNFIETCLRDRKTEARVVVESGRPEDDIVSLAGDLPAQLVVVGSTGRSRLNRVLLGGVAEQVVSTAPCSVLVVRSSSIDEIG